MTMVTLDELALAPERVAELSHDARQRVLLRCSAVLAALSAAPAAANTKDRMLTTEQATERLGFSKWKLYKHAADYPFARRDGGRWLFSELGIDAWLAGKR